MAGAAKRCVRQQQRDEIMQRFVSQVNTLSLENLLHKQFFTTPSRYGAAGWDRTSDPWLRRPILYPLSYSRIEISEEACRIPSFLSGVHGLPGFSFQTVDVKSIIKGLAKYCITA
jgi:hypothetical protein